MRLLDEISGVPKTAALEAKNELIGLISPSGLANEFIEIIVLFPAALALIWILQALVHVGRREWRLPTDEAFQPSVAVVIPAHNEELVIGAAIDALLEQDYPNLEIHVVSDGSTDDTAAVARAHAKGRATVHELSTNVGKSLALQAALDGSDTDLFMVVDADTVAAPGAITQVVQQFADPRVAGVTGNPRVRAVSNPLMALQAMEYAVIVSLAKRADQFWGGLYTVSGAAACFRTAALRAVGGWSKQSVTEDIEISWRLQRNGWLLRYEPRAIFHIQTPRRLRALYRQRIRWAQGMVEVLRLHWRAPGGSNASVLPIAAQVLASLTWIVFVTAYLCFAVAAVTTGGGDAFGVVPGVLTSQVFLWTFGLFAIQAMCAALFDGAHARQDWRPLLLAPVFPLYFWAIVYPSFLIGATRGMFGRLGQPWTRTERVALHS